MKSLTEQSLSKEKLTHYRWTICALLFFATTINYIDRSIFSLIKPVLDDELKWSNEQYGIVNAAFQGAYGIGLLIFGGFIDRVGVKVGYAVSIAAWSLAAMGHGFVSNLNGFIVARISLGLGEGGNFPSAIKATTIWFPARERALATSIFNSGTNIGAILAPAIVPWIVITWGWRMTFIIAGIAGFVWLLFWFPLFNIPEKIRQISHAERDMINSDQSVDTGDAEKISWITLMQYPQTWSFIFGKFMTDPIWWFFLIWLPDYFKTTRGLYLKDSWIYLVTIYSIITVLSVLGGWITGHLTQRGWTVTRARKTGMLIFALCVVPILAVTQVSNWTAVFLIALAGAAHQAWMANLYTSVSDMFPKNAIASIVGIGGLAGAISGVYFPIFCGQMLDKFIAMGNVTAGYSILFSICASAYLIAFAVNHLLAPKFEKIHISSI
ncbi:MAG: MFS transporter [Hyphomonadaceae bacterium]|nr:MFS transporter [Clostridia bacterium]